MVTDKKLFSFLLTTENKKVLEKMSEERKLSKAEILNAMIANHANNGLKKAINENSINDKNTKIYEIRSHFSKDEYEVLKSLAQKEFLSVKRYVKFLVSQKIYDKDTPSNSEVLELQEIKNQLIRLGVNMNSVAKKINTDSNINRDTISLLEDTLQNIIKDRKNFENKISAFKKINEARF